MKQHTLVPICRKHAGWGFLCVANQTELLFMSWAWNTWMCEITLTDRKRTRRHWCFTCWTPFNPHEWKPSWLLLPGAFINKSSHKIGTQHKCVTLTSTHLESVQQMLNLLLGSTLVHITYIWVTVRSSTEPAPSRGAGWTAVSSTPNGNPPFPWWPWIC